MQAQELIKQKTNLENLGYYNQILQRFHFQLV